MMDKPTAEAIRHYVADGGTVIMTGYSAKVDETGKWFETPLPGRLTDVFGLRTNRVLSFRSSRSRSRFNGKKLTGTDGYYEVLEPSTAKALASFENTPQKSPAITINHFGKGEAIYLATAPQPAFLGPLVRSLYGKTGDRTRPRNPGGCCRPRGRRAHAVRQHQRRSGDHLLRRHQARRADRRNPCRIDRTACPGRRTDAMTPRPRCRRNPDRPGGSR